MDGRALLKDVLFFATSLLVCRSRRHLSTPVLHIMGQKGQRGGGKCWRLTQILLFLIGMSIVWSLFHTPESVPIRGGVDTRRAFQAVGLITTPTTRPTSQADTDTQKNTLADIKSHPVAAQGTPTMRKGMVITGYKLTQGSECSLPVCDLNKGHQPVVMVTNISEHEVCSDISECVTVTVKTRHRLYLVANMIKSLHTYFPGTKVIVADEFYPKYSDEAPDSWKREYLKGPPELVTYFQTRPGVGYGRHIAAQMASTKYILVADDDYIFTNNTTLNTLLRALEHSDLSIAGGATDDKFPFDGAMKVWQPDNQTAHLVIYPQVFHEDLHPFAPCYVSDLVKNFFLAKRKNILKAGGWDLRRMYYEHEDFFFQMRKKRLKVAHCPDVVIEHPSIDRKLAKERKKNFKRWSALLKDKWGFHDYYYCNMKSYQYSQACKNRKGFA